MATFTKRGNRWRVQIMIDGVRQSATFRTKGEAANWARDQEDLRASPTARKTLGDAFDRYAKEVTPNKRGEKWELVRLTLLGKHSFANTLMADITPATLAEWRDDRLKQVAAASVAREMTIINSVLELARREWGWMTTSPHKDVRKPRSPRPRDRRISEAEIMAICGQLGYIEGEPVTTKQPQIAVAFMLAIETAMRAGELMALEWADVHLEQRYVALHTTKNEDKRNVPLSKRAVELFTMLQGFDPVKVFTVSGSTRDTLFRNAVKRADVIGLTFHDSRHEALTRLARKLDVLDLARMVGHRDVKSLMIYYNATATEIASRLD